MRRPAAYGEGVSVRRFLLLALIASAGGGVLGWFGYGFLQAAALPARVERSDRVRTLLRDYERGTWGDIARDEAERLGEEALLLWALSDRDAATLRALASDAQAASVRVRAARALAGAP